MNKQRWIALVMSLLAVFVVIGQYSEAQLEDPFIPDENCQLPCWWGIVPGETTLVEADQILTQMGINERSFGSGETFLTGYGIYPEIPSITSEETRIYAHVPADENGNIQYFHISSTNAKSGYLKTVSLLSNMGVPDRIYLYAEQTEKLGLLADNMVIYWDTIGIVTVNVRDYFLPLESPICLGGSQSGFSVTMYQPSTYVSLDQINQYLEGGLWLITDISDFTNAEFAQLLIDNDGCLPPNLPVDWDRPAFA